MDENVEYEEREDEFDIVSQSFACVLLSHSLTFRTHSRKTKRSYMSVR